MTKTYTFTEADLATEDSWYGIATVKVLPTWTPTASGTATLEMGEDNGDSDYADGNFDIYIWRGNTLNVDYPGPTDASADFDNNANGVDVYPPSHLEGTLEVEAGQPYTIIAVDWNGVDAVGHTIDLTAFYASLAEFGGFVTPSSTGAHPGPTDSAALPGPSIARTIARAVGTAIDALPPASIVWRVFDITHATPGLEDGVDLFTPNAGDLIADIRVHVVEAFNGTTPFLDVGTFVTQAQGLFDRIAGRAVDLTAADNDGIQTGLLIASQTASLALLTAIAGVSYQLQISGEGPNFEAYNTPYMSGNGDIIVADPPPRLQVIVSTNGNDNGDPTGATTGHAKVFVGTITPIEVTP